MPNASANASGRQSRRADRRAQREHPERGDRHRQDVRAAVEHHQRERRRRQEDVLPRPGLEGLEEEVQLKWQVETGQEHAVADPQVDRGRARRGHQGRQIDHRRRESDSDDAGHEEVHPDEADPVMQHDVDLHRELQRHHRRERIHRAEERDLRVLPHHVAAAVPRIPVRHLAVLDHVLQDRAVVEEVLIPVVDAEGQGLREERRAKCRAEDAVERAPGQRARSVL